jgi:hypothetical protein
MQGVDPYAYLQQVAASLESLSTRREIETVLDELEYLYEIIDPELMYLADDLIERLRKRLRGMP